MLSIDSRSGYHISNRSRVGLPPSIPRGEEFPIWIFSSDGENSRFALRSSIFLVIIQVEAYMLTLHALIFNTPRWLKKSDSEAEEREKKNLPINASPR